MTYLLNLLFAGINYGAPLMFATSGEILTEKAGNTNLGVEGMMWLGAFTGFYTAYKTKSLLMALLAGFFSAAASALIYAFLTVSLRANQNVIGLALTTFGIGLSKVLGQRMVQTAGTNPTLDNSMNAILSDIHIPLLSDIPFIGKLLFSDNILIYLGSAICIMMHIYLNHTRVGLNIRAVGENPAAADAAGINVTKVKYFNIIVGGGICGLGGTYMSIITANHVWMQSGIVNGFGWIAVALVIFASWKPLMAILGAFIFGLFTVLQYYPLSGSIPTAIYQMFPFLLTMIVLIVTSMRKKREGVQPASCGINYFREER